MATLTASEQRRLADCEATIAQQRGSLLRALAEIRDKRLYRATHATFADYLRDMGQSHTHRLADAVVQTICPAGESQSRPRRDKVAGKEYVTPAMRRQASNMFGTLVRLLDRMGISKSVDIELKTILRAIKEAQ